MQQSSLGGPVEPSPTLRAAFRQAAPAISLYLLFQLVAFGVLWMMSWKADVSPGRFIDNFDANWFLSVAQHGYDQPVVHGADGLPVENSLVFFPLYPATVALLTLVGIPPLAAGMTISLLAGCAAAWGLFVLGRDLAGPRVGLLVAVLWSIGPGSTALHLAYSESLLMALVSWTFVMLARREWLVAGGFAVLAGLTRASSGALIAAVGIAALIAVFQRRDGWRPWAGGLIAPLGLLGYLGYVWIQTGRPDGWLWLQNAWQMHFDFGVFTWTQVREGLTSDNASWITVTALVVLTAVVLQFWTWATKLPLPWQIYGTLTVVIALCSSNFFQSRARFLLPAFVLTVPVALMLAKLPNRVLAVLLPVITVGSAWYGAFLLTIAHVAP